MTKLPGDMLGRWVRLREHLEGYSAAMEANEMHVDWSDICVLDAFLTDEWDESYMGPEPGKDTTPPQEATTQPLWDDDRIEDFVNAKYDASEYFEVLGAMQIIRNDYQAELASLRQQLADAQAWEPIRDSYCSGAESLYGEYLRIKGNHLEIFNLFNTCGLPDILFELSDDIRICRRRTQEAKDE